MAPLDKLEASARDAVCDHLSRLKHDLGKYVAFQIRWLPEDAPFEQRREALCADLLETRRGPESTTDAVTVWGAARPALYGEAPIRDGLYVDLSGEPLVESLDEHMRGIAAVVDALRSGADDEQIIDDGTKLALAVADACKQLLTRARGGR